MRQGLTMNAKVQIFVCMAMLMVASFPQYTWTQFVNPIDDVTRWGKANIQFTYFTFGMAQAVTTGVLGILVDRSFAGPRIVALFGAVMLYVGLSTEAHAASVELLWQGGLVTGIGVGALTAACYGSALKWAPGKSRGIALGVTAFGYGGGTFFILPFLPISHWIRDFGYQVTLEKLGIILGLLVAALAFFMRSWPENEIARESEESKRAIVSIPHGIAAFVVVYLAFVLVALSGSMIIAQRGPMASSFGMRDVQLTFLWVTQGVLTWTIMLDSLANGLSRLFFGKLSDRTGRPPAMGIAFCLEAIGFVWLSYELHNPMMFVVLTGLVFFAYGEIFGLFPALIGDMFRKRNIAAIFCLLYTAKGFGAIAPWASSYLVKGKLVTWEQLLWIGASLDILAAILILAVVPRLMRRATNPT